MLTRRANRFCCADRGDHRIDLLGQPRDHRLARRDIPRHLDAGVVGDQRRGASASSVEQCDRALAGQPRHQPGPDGDHPQPSATTAPRPPPPR